MLSPNSLQSEKLTPTNLQASNRTICSPSPSVRMLDKSQSTHVQFSKRAPLKSFSDQFTPWKVHASNRAPLRSPHSSERYTVGQLIRSLVFVFAASYGMESRNLPESGTSALKTSCFCSGKSSLKIDITIVQLSRYDCRFTRTTSHIPSQQNSRPKIVA